MRILRVIIVTWLLTYVGAVVGMFLGRPFGHQGPFVGAVVLGTLAILLALKLLARFGWFDNERRRGGSIGALCGFALAVPLASMNVDTPLVPLLVMGLVGVGVIAGAGPSAAV